MRSSTDVHPRTSGQTVAVYRDILLNPNEPFIRSQAESLQRYRSMYFCVKRVDGLDVPRERTFALHAGSRRGRAMEYVFKATGICPPLTRHLQSIKPSLLHAYTGVDAAVAMPLARRLRVPLVVTFTGFDATATDEQLRNSSQRCWTYMRRRERLRHSARLTIAVSQFIKRVLQGRGYADDEVAVHYIGVDVDLFRAHPQVARQPLVLFAGRLIEMKGTTYLLRAMQAVQARCPQAELVIAGDGELRASLETEARDLRLRVRFLGYQSPAEIRSWMSAARILCIPSINASNGMADSLPVVGLEAQAMGLPVVAFDTGGLSEEIRDGETGILVPERDVASLTQAIDRLLTDAELWQRFSAAAPLFMRETFDLRRQTARLETLYDQVLTGSPVSAARTTAR